jgi:hypothetical protein
VFRTPLAIQTGEVRDVNGFVYADPGHTPAS